MLAHLSGEEPVEMPQLRMQALSKGAIGLIFTTLPEWTTVYWLKVDVPRKWLIGLPLIENLDLPSLIMTSLAGFTLNKSHILLSSDLQCGHSPHSPVNTGSTWSPGFRFDTPSPTLSTTLLNKENLAMCPWYHNCIYNTTHVFIYHYVKWL